MMRDLRARTKGILWFVVFAFVGSIGLIWGADVLGPSGASRVDPSVIGSVNGVKILTTQYSRAIERAHAAYEAEHGRRPSIEDEFYDLREEAWESLVTEILLAQEIQNRRIRVLDEEILMHAKANPPPEVRQMEIFQTDGRFDHAKYLQALQDPRYDWRALEYHLRMQLPRIKLEQQIISSARVTEWEVRDTYTRQNEKIKMTYAFFGPSDFLDQEIPSTEEELVAYYEAHGEDYRLPERAKLRCVRWKKDPSPEDDAVVREQLDEIYREIERGEDFGELAEIYSDDPGSASQGGDVGFFGRGEMVKEFEEAAFSLDVGQVSEPVRTRYGYHIIKVEEKKEDQVRARHILFEMQPSRRTLEDLWVAAAEFDSVAAASGFDGAAEAAGVEVFETDLFPRGSFIPGIGRSKQGNRLAFEKPEGSILGPLDLVDAYVVCQVAARDASRIPAFDDVIERVKRDFEASRRRELARAESERVAAEISGGKTLEQAAPSPSTRHAGPFSETTAVGTITGDPTFIGTAFALPEGRISGLIETKSGYAILRVDERIPINEEQYQKEKEELRRRLLLRKQEAVFSLWFNQLYESAKIEDLRERARPS